MVPTAGLATAASVPPGAGAVTERPGRCGRGTGVAQAAGVFGLPAATRLQLTSGGGPARHEESVYDTSIRDNLRARDSPAGPSANERHVCAARLSVRAAAAPTSRVVRRRAPGSASPSAARTRSMSKRSGALGPSPASRRPIRVRGSRPSPDARRGSARAWRRGRNAGPLSFRRGAGRRPESRPLRCRRHQASQPTRSRGLNRAGQEPCEDLPLRVREGSADRLVRDAKRPIARSRACASGVCDRSVCCPQVGSTRAATRRWPESGRHHPAHPAPPRTASSTSTSRSRGGRASPRGPRSRRRGARRSRDRGAHQASRVEVDLKRSWFVRPPPALTASRTTRGTSAGIGPLLARRARGPRAVLRDVGFAARAAVHRQQLTRGLAQPSIAWPDPSRR